MNHYFDLGAVSRVGLNQKWGHRWILLSHF